MKFFILFREKSGTVIMINDRKNSFFIFILSVENKNGKYEQQFN